MSLFRIIQHCLIVLAFFFLSQPAQAAPACAGQYETAKQEMARLLQNDAKAELRTSWERLDALFLQLYEKNPRWANRPAALLRAGEALMELGSRTLLKRDLRLSLSRFERLTSEYPESQLADDALYKAARLQGDWLNDSNAATQLLDRLLQNYPKGDMASLAQAYKQELTTASPSGNAETQLQRVVWEDRNGFTFITLDLDHPTSWSLLSDARDTKQGTPPRLILELKRTVPAPTVRPVVKNSGSQLRRLRVDLSRPGATRLLMDFKNMKAFSIAGKNGYRQLIITTTPTGKGLTASTPAGGTRQRRLPNNGSPLILIDPGHGGTDEGHQLGTNTEKEMTLRLSRLLLSELQAKGLQARVTRTDNTWVSLDTRSRMANRLDADFFISLHASAETKKAAPRLRFWLYGGNEPATAEFVQFENNQQNELELHPVIPQPSPQKKTGSKNNASQKQEKSTIVEPDLPSVPNEGILADSHRIAEALSAALQQKRGKACSIQTGQLQLLAKADVPCVIFELGSAADPEEQQKESSEAFLQQLARDLASAIAEALPLAGDASSLEKK